ncbi:MAG: alanine--glyoxylate aminotransferase family protein [Anaerolineae bacterium]|nr:alanine--glyoxylate aminotransferase family protein [Anaerolineae bacterium]MDW8099078.1 alanine--glyoxylate aminotransferase family protein [Anaerolineae bacterium]
METHHPSRFSDLNPSPRLLLGPGPSMVHPRVLRALATPPIGHLDPEFITIMNEIQELLRFVFETTNRLTLPISGTGSAGMEAALCNFIEPGDPVLICVNGYFGERMVDMATRYGAEVHRIDVPWGAIFSAKQVEEALRAHPAKLVAIVHAETSTGALQPLEEIAEVTHRYGALLLVDAVTSLGGLPVEVDRIGIDICYSGSQKCLSCPPGLAPITVSPRAEEVLRARKTRVANWYLDLTMVQKYWGNDRTYHHTAPINMNYALREGLRLIEEEGLQERFARHRRNAQMLWDGLTELGLTLHVPLDHRLPSLTTVRVPDGVDEAAVRRRLLDEYNIEIAGGLGVLRGKIWRIGLMGHSSRPENVVALLGALERILG